MGDLLVRKTTKSGISDRSWLANDHGVNANKSIVIDASLFDKDTYWADGWLKAGIALGQVTATKMYGPYGGSTNEKQTVTEGGAGLTSYTLTFGGQTTDDIDPQATAAELQAALEALDTIGEGNVIVTGDAGGPYTVQFVGALAETDVAAMTSTPTGGSGTVTIATGAAGGASRSDGTDTFAGLLFADVEVFSSTSRVTAALFRHGFVIEANLPANHGVDAGAKTDAAGRMFFE